MRDGRGAARLLASALLFVAAGHAAPEASAAFRNVHSGMEAPSFRLESVSGEEVSLEALKKEKAVLLVFWAGWSERSLDELRDIEKMLPEYAPEGLKAVAINVEHEQMTAEDRGAVRDTVARLGLSYPVLFDPGLATFGEYGVIAVPSTAILGEGGVVRSVFNGYPSSAFLDMNEQVARLLGLRKEEAATAVAEVEAGHRPAHAALLQYNLGKRLHDSGMGEMAEPKLRKAAEADPQWAAPRILLGEIHLSRAKKDPARVSAAVREFEAAVAAEKENVAARTGLARACLRAGSAARAETEADEVLKANASYTPALLLKAEILAGNGKLPEAETLMAEAFALNPGDAGSYALAGKAYERAGELSKAARMYRKAWEKSGQ